MRTSATNIKGRKSGSELQEKPREGSRLRVFYDRAMTGKWFDIRDLKTSRHGHNMLANLRDFYGLEITHRRVGQHVEYRGTGIWIGTILHSISDVEVAIDHTQGQ